MGPLHPDGCSKTPRGWTTTCCRKDTAKQDHAGSLKPGGSRFVLYQCFLSVILSHSIPCWSVMIVNSFYKEALQLIYHQSIETKVLLYWRGGKPDVKSMYQRYSQSNQNIRLFCACLACNRKNFVSGFTFPFHSIVLKDTGNCNENDLKFCSIIWYRNQSIDFQPRFSSPLSS